MFLLLIVWKFGVFVQFTMTSLQKHVVGDDILLHSVHYGIWGYCIAWCHRKPILGSVSGTQLVLWGPNGDPATRNPVSAGRDVG